jgi:hypothetical protein
MLWAANAAEKLEGFLRAQNDGQSLRFLRCRNYIFEEPVLTERNFIEEAEGRHSDENGPWGQLPFVGQVNLVVADSLRTQLFRDLSKYRANRETCCRYEVCVFTARFRTCMSSVMRCRREVMENSFAKWNLLHKQPLHASASEISQNPSNVTGSGWF